MPTTLPHARQIQRQTVLPTSKAIEIAYKSIRQRLSRSLLVTSGIVLALAFLMSIQTTQNLLDSMRQWDQQINAEHAAAVHEKTPQLNESRSRFMDAQSLEQLMASKGVPTSAADIAADRVQTRWVLGLALMVAFVGILNAMLMSVTERFREIGTMKCLGALDSFIIKLFLIESLFQGIVGAVLGVTIGFALSFISAISNYHGYVWKNLHPGAIMTSAAGCALAGVALTVAGALYPAWQAARMRPIEAMRVEA